MNIFPQNYDVTITIPLTDLNDVAITPDAVIGILTDGDDREIVNFGYLEFVPGAEMTFVVPAVYNQLGEEFISGRTLKVGFETVAGEIWRSFPYIVQMSETLVALKNTFQSYQAAEIYSVFTTNKDGWNVSTETGRRTALAEAFSRITALPMKYCPVDDIGRPILAQETKIARADWAEFTLDAFLMLPSAFQKALRKAQFVEANELMLGAGVEEKRRQGIASESVGESSMTFRPGHVDYGLSRAALSALVGYIDFNMRIAR